MSGLLGAFQSFLQQAYWRGIPFYVDAQETEKGRKTAVHEYPFRDGGWTEDLGRKQRVYRFTGHLIGDFAPLLQVALDAAIELPGPGLLIHPTLGAVKVALLSASTSVRKDQLRVISVEFTFVEQGASIFPSIITNTINAVIGAVSDALLSFGSLISVGAVALALVSAALPTIEAASVTQSFASTSTTIATDPAALLGMATALPPPNDNTWYGRYATGNATTQLPPGTTVASLQAQLATQRATVAACVTTAVAAASTLSPTTAPALVTAIAALVEAVRATQTDPGDQVRTLTTLVTFTYTDSYGGAGLSGAVGTVRDAVAVTCRRCALASLALACAAYQPFSYQDAEALRAQVAALFDVEITAAGDAGDDDAYVALKTLRATVIQDLTARAAALPLVMTVTLPSNQPSLVVAYRLYQDSGRADQIVTETGVIHPAFLPTTMQVLAS